MKFEVAGMENGRTEDPVGGNGALAAGAGWPS